MSREVVLRVGEDEHPLPTVVPTLGPPAIDIARLTAETGFITLDGGYGNTAETRSAITYIDGEKGVLLYRGYPIEQLAEEAGFLEVAHLLYYGELPTRDQLDAYESEITHHTLIREDMRHLFEAFPTEAHPMQILAAATSALASYYPDAVDPSDLTSIDLSAARLIAKAPTMVAWSYKYRAHQPYMYPRNDLDYVANFLHMMFAVPAEPYVVDPVVAKALTTLFILHADHGQNCSASTVRLVGSGQADIYSSISAGVHALSGQRHGGANQEVMEMLEEIHAGGGNVGQYVAKAKDRSDPFRLMGFGHRIYRNFDPRANIIKQAAGEVLDKLGVTDPLLDIAAELEEAALADDYFIERKLYPNVDFYSGIIYRAIGFPTDMFTVLFAIGRLPGWIAQWKEMATEGNGRIGRPEQVYSGPPRRDFVPLEDR